MALSCYEHRRITVTLLLFQSLRWKSYGLCQGVIIFIWEKLLFQSTMNKFVKNVFCLNHLYISLQIQLSSCSSFKVLLCFFLLLPFNILIFNRQSSLTEVFDLLYIVIHVFGVNISYITKYTFIVSDQINSVYVCTYWLCNNQLSQQSVKQFYHSLNHAFLFSVSCLFDMIVFHR